MTARPGTTSATKLPRLLAPIAWLSFLANVLIIGTGGAVRLTGSGMGCPTWPLCTAESLVPTEELTYHSLIEFGNRTLTGLLVILALAVLILSWRARRQRRDLFVLAIVVLVGIIVQAIMGGIVVWLHLNANLVGLHYVLSVILVCITAAFLVRMKTVPGPRELVVPRTFRLLGRITAVVLAVTVYVGVLTTGAGPHSGDANIQRDGFDASILAHVHAWPGYVLFALTLAMLVWAAMRNLQPRTWLTILLVAQLVQIAVGIYQARTGLPPIAVGVHMVLASLCAAAMTVVIMRFTRPVAAE